MNNYTGWSLYDTVTLVIKDTRCKHKYGAPQAFVVNPKDKKQLNTAMNWGSAYISKLDANGNIQKDSRGNTIYETVDPTVKNTDNKGFKLTLLETAGNSSQGGKLSFWNCLIEKEEDDIKCVVGIDSNLLLAVLLQNTFINGACQNTLSFARCSGGVGLLNEDMQEYKDAIRDEQLKKSLSTGKTTKYQVGKNYITLTQDETYLGKVYRVMSIESQSNYGHSNRRCNISITRTNDKESAVHIITDTYDCKGMTKISEYFNKVMTGIEKLNVSRISDITWKAHPFIHNHQHPLIKLPSRKTGEMQLSIDIDVEAETEKILTTVKTMLLEELKKGNHLAIDELSSVIVSAYPLTLETLSDLDKEIIKIVLSEDNIRKYYGDNMSVTLSCDNDCTKILKELMK